MKRWMWGGLVLFFVLFSLAPNFYELGRMNDLHSDRYFELVHNFPTDYNFYLSRIRQGREGALTVHEKYTSEAHPGSYIQIMYLLMGKVSAWVGVPWPRSGDTYQTARIILAVTLLFVIAYLAKSLFRKPGWQIAAFCLATAAGAWPILVFHAGEWRLGGYMPWWTIMDALQRITFVPHMLAGQALIIFLLIALSSEATMRRPGNWIFLGFIACILGVIFPPGLVFVAVVYAVFVGIDGIFVWRSLKNKNDRSDFILTRLAGPAVVGLMSAPTLLYLSLALRVYPWKRLVDFAILHPQPFQLRDYILAVGPMLEIGVLGGLWVLWKKEKNFFMPVAWVVSWAALIIVFGYVPQESPLRFTEMLPQVPLAILTVYLLSTLSYLSTLWKKLMIGLAAILILLNLAQLYSSWRWQKEFIDQKIAATYPLVPTGSYVMYPLKDMISAMIFIQDHTSRDTVILSETTAGNYMPVYSGNTVYVGHANTVGTEQKEQIVNAFFSGRMGPTKAKEFLTANSLHYIFFGPQESDDGGIADLSKVYPFLTEIYTRGLFHIYHW